MTIDRLEQALAAIDGPNLRGRVPVFQAAEAAARQVLTKLHIEAGDEQTIAAAVLVLVNIAGDIVQHMCVEADWPASHVMLALDRVRSQLQDAVKL